ncbi:hypothetical protein ACMT1E_09190 [Sphingomonas flavalba]|uniref:hypothetical protein n=1 Tax=Sphingomonas flavalba TaxID=2559804 RepID=UPI0039DF4638
MSLYRMVRGLALVLSPALLLVGAADAHKLRTAGERVTVADSKMAVTPSRDWNRLGIKAGRHAETWTLDGTQLNDLTFYGGIAPGEPLVRERSRKHDPLPRFAAETLLVEIPGLLEGTYRTYKQIGTFAVQSVDPVRFLGHDGVHFTYQYTDDDQIVRRGDAQAAIVDGRLYMVTFDAPRLHYFDRDAGAADAVMDSAGF